MSKLRLDLHVHSSYSADGCMEISSIVELARSKGLDGVAICDHNRVYTDAAEYEDFLLIPGVEISTQYGHLLGLFVSRPVETNDLFEAVRLIKEQGGLAVLAHPYEHKKYEGKLDEIAGELDGVEAWNARADRKNRSANAQALEFAKKYALPVTGGSDAHTPPEVGNGYAVIEVSEKSLEAAKEALKSGSGTAEGVRAKATATAKSQFVRRVKQGASFKSYVKWSLFAAKCVLQDLIGG